MTPNDVAYIRKLVQMGVIESPCLELGAGAEWGDLRKFLDGAGIETYTSDVVDQNGVDFVVDIGVSRDVERVFRDAPRFKTILVMNVLEHTFEPILVLDNVFSLLADGGHAVLVTPVVWPLHRAPLDYWRINPDFYEEYAKRRGFRLMPEVFEYVGQQPCYANYSNTVGFALPQPSQSRWRTLYSRVVHRVFNTTGRGQRFPSYAAVGAVMQKRRG